MKQNRVIGIAGSIASGKSTVGKILRELGCIVIDADQIARDIVDKGTPAYERITEHFPQVMDGEEIDRKKLAQVIFQDPKQRELLNSLLHPLILEDSRRQFAIHHDLVFYEAPLLFESEILHDMDMTIYVKARQDVQLKRLIARDGIDEAYARQKLAAFKEPDVIPSITLYNNGTIDELRKAVQLIVKQLRKNLT